jgi:hypothetical protein
VRASLLVFSLVVMDVMHNLISCFRGKYHPPNAPPDGEKPLYLHISAGAHVSMIYSLHN